MGTLIPRKSWYVHAELHKSMKHTHRTEKSFERFKSLVRQNACILDKTKKKEEQDAEVWHTFLTQILAVQPELAMYQDFWPIQSYWESFARKTWVKSGKATAVREDLPDIVFMGRKSPPISRIVSAATTSRHRVHSSSSKLDAACVTQSDSIRAQMQVSFSTSRSCSTRSFPAFTPTSASYSSFHNADRENETEREMAAIAFCPLCEPPSRVDAWMNSELRRCLSYDESLLTILADAGILLDQHLHVLCKFSEEDRASFLKSIPSCEMYTVEKSQILDALNSAAFCHDRVECITAPSALVELEIINPALEGSQASLRKAMRLQAHQTIFEDLWSVMKSGSVSFLQLAHPGIGDLANVIDGVLRKRPLFLKYDNFWPIRLYLLRMQTVANVHPTYHTQEEMLQFIEAFVQYRSEHITLRPATTTVVQIPCRKHNPLDLSLVHESVQAALHARGLGELIPVMPYLAVINEDELAAFTSYSDDEKDDAVKFSELKLTRFQEFVLKKAFV